MSSVLIEELKYCGSTQINDLKLCKISSALEINVSTLIIMQVSILNYPVIYV